MARKTKNATSKNHSGSNPVVAFFKNRQLILRALLSHYILNICVGTVFRKPTQVTTLQVTCLCTEKSVDVST